MPRDEGGDNEPFLSPCERKGLGMESDGTPQTTPGPAGASPGQFPLAQRGGFSAPPRLDEGDLRREAREEGE